MEFNIINPITYPGWDRFIVSCADYSFFHTSAWAKILYESYRYNLFYFTLANDKKIFNLIPVMEITSILTGKRGVSIPFSDYCEPLISKRKYFEELIERIIDHGRKSGWKYFELRGGSQYVEDLNPFSHYYVHFLNLNREENELIQSFRYNVRYDIKKAIKKGVCTKLYYSFDAVKEYYRLHCMTRKKHGLPPQPYYFFKNIYRYIISKNHGFVILATDNDKTIAGGIFFHIGEKAIIKYEASDMKYKHLNANKLLIWEAIKWYSKNGFKYFSFGRTNPENKGLIQFKDGWGTEKKKLNYYMYYICKKEQVKNRQNFSINGNTMLKKMPVFLLKAVGRIVYRHIG